MYTSWGLPSLLSKPNKFNSHIVNSEVFCVVFFYLEHKDSTVTVIFLLWNTLWGKNKMIIKIRPNNTLQIRKFIFIKKKQET